MAYRMMALRWAQLSAHYGEDGKKFFLKLWRVECAERRIFANFARFSR